MFSSSRAASRRIAGGPSRGPCVHASYQQAWRRAALKGAVHVATSFVQRPAHFAEAIAHMGRVAKLRSGHVVGDIVERRRSTGTHGLNSRQGDDDDQRQHDSVFHGRRAIFTDQKPPDFGHKTAHLCLLCLKFESGTLARSHGRHFPSTRWFGEVMHGSVTGIARSTLSPPLHPFGSPTIPDSRDSRLCAPPVATSLFEDEGETIEASRFVGTLRPSERDPRKLSRAVCSVFHSE